MDKRERKFGPLLPDSPSSSLSDFTFFVSAGSKAWYRSGLAKSAFTSRIYGGLPLENYMPLIDETSKFYHIRIKRAKGLFISPKFYMTHDASLMYYRPYNEVVASLKKRPRKASAWWRVVRAAVNSSEFFELNRITAGSQDLAALAAAKFLAELLRKVADEMEDNRQYAEKYGTARDLLEKASDSEVEQLFGGGQQLQQAVEEAVKEAKEAVEEYAEAVEAAEEAASLIAGAGGNGYVRDALSVLEFLSNPERFRERVVIIKWAAIMMKEFTRMLPTSMVHQQTVSIWGGISGISRMLSESQLKDILPSELAALAARNEKLAKMLKYDFLLRLLSKQVSVYQRAAAIRPIIFVDRSGSMEELFDRNVPKISIASGFALALYRRLQGEVYLFDTEVEKVRPSDVVKVLLRVRASGGTDIDAVLREVLAIGRKDYVYIVITDGMSEVEQDTIAELRRRGLAQRIRFILIPPAWEAPWLKENFRYWKVNDIAEFKAAARAALTG